MNRKLKYYYLKSFDDLIELKDDNNSYDCIEIDLSILKNKGLIRNSVKYALWHVKLGGELHIISNPFESFKHSKKNIDFWQISREVFKSIGKDIKCIKYDQKKGIIRLKKIHERYKNNGISFGISFSGGSFEVPRLIQSLDSICNSYLNTLHQIPVEVIISGPSNFDYSSIVARYQKINLRYESLDLGLHCRFLITRKKNFLYSAASYNIVVLTHTRILFPENFISNIYERKFDLSTTKVFSVDKGKEIRYLDVGLISSYDLSKKNSAITIAGEMIVLDTLKYLSKRVIYIDGGLTILNKNTLPRSPYNEEVAWGEAEDIELCERLSQCGMLIDIFNDITCKSSVIKFKKKSLIKKAVYYLYSKLMFS